LFHPVRDAVLGSHLGASHRASGIWGRFTSEIVPREIIPAIGR
jgi:hypothetical protein